MCIAEAISLHFHIFKIKLQFIRVKTEVLRNGRGAGEVSYLHIHVPVINWEKPSLHFRPTPRLDSAHVKSVINIIIQNSKRTFNPTSQYIYIKFKLSYVHRKGSMRLE